MLELFRADCCPLMLPRPGQQFARLQKDIALLTKCPAVEASKDTVDAQPSTVPIFAEFDAVLPLIVPFQPAVEI